MDTNEEDLVRALKIHDDLVTECALGKISFAEFDMRYDDFYVRYPLDGHESGPAAQELFRKYSHRIIPHRKIWDEVLTKVTSDELLTHPGSRAAGFISHDEATQRIREIAVQYCNVCE